MLACVAITQALISGLIAQTLISPDLSPLLDYGLAGGLILIIIFLFKDFRSAQNKENKQRDAKYAEVILDLKDVIKQVDHNYSTALAKMDVSYTDAINRFVNLIDKQMDQMSYVAGELTRLADQIEGIKNGDNKQIESMKKDILAAIDKIVLHYELKKKD